jgi:DNA-binding transcriptional ArsR family regulator
MGTMRVEIEGTNLLSRQMGAPKVDAELDQVFGALAHPTRRAILARLRRGPASVNEIAAPFRVSQQAISKQIAVLRAAGLITQVKRGRESRCELSALALKQADDWMDLYRPLWEERFDKLADYLDRPRSER